MVEMKGALMSRRYGLQWALLFKPDSQRILSL
jgi:hypothetical protein